MEDNEPPTLNLCSIDVEVELNVECVTDIEWDDVAFDQLAIDPDRKILIRGLVKTHASLKEARSVGDFVAGKGSGLIMNLFGPPGVGETLTMKATNLRKPLYVVSAGDLGTDPTSLDRALTKIFSLVPVWDAVVLIDEADVFLEERETADVERNAMVAIFPGDLVLDDEPRQQFDAAFQSRIHLSLRYNDLSRVEKEQLWRAFWDKTRTAESAHTLSAEQLEALSSRSLNGRQIKNIVKLTVALAAEEENPPTYAHLMRTIGISDDWGSGDAVTPPSG
ncbi:hypothetical protein DFH09DRAFT_1477318 [Mycena vulgaris]|nr:hypothetical protein DFH09DRAFT_1477318 [Mycena vulgaris]